MLRVLPTWTLASILLLSAQPSAISQVTGFDPSIGPLPAPPTPFGTVGYSVDNWHFDTVMGDINGDGVDDLGFTYSAKYDPNNGSLKVGFWDGKTGSLLNSHDHFPPPVAAPPVGQPAAQQYSGRFGASITILGDLNCDGFSEYAISDYSYGWYASPPLGRICIYLGGRSTTTPATLQVATAFSGDLMCVIDGNTPPMQGTTGTSFGKAIASAGDLDADSLPDLLVGAPTWTIGTGANERRGAVLMYSGYQIEQAWSRTFASSTGTYGVGALSATSAVGTISIPIASGVAYLGRNVEGGDDVTGDGVPDILVAARWVEIDQVSGQGTKAGVILYSGRNLSRPLHVYSAPLGHSGNSNPFNFGLSMAFIGDVEGLLASSTGGVQTQSTSDVLIGDPGEASHLSPDPGNAYVFSSQSGDLLEAHNGSTVILSLQVIGSKLGMRVASAGDVDGDGFGDYYLEETGFDPTGVATYPDMEGRVVVVLGNTNTKLPPLSSQTIVPDTSSFMIDVLPNTTSPSGSNYTFFGPMLASSGLPNAYNPVTGGTGFGFLAYIRDGVVDKLVSRLVQ